MVSVIRAVTPISTISKHEVCKRLRLPIVFFIFIFFSPNKLELMSFHQLRCIILLQRFVETVLGLSQLQLPAQ